MDEQSSSTSARTCEVKNSVLPSALSRRRTDFTATRVAGSRPLIGSSRGKRARPPRKQEASARARRLLGQPLRARRVVTGPRELQHQLEKLPATQVVRRDEALRKVDQAAAR